MGRPTNVFGNAAPYPSELTGQADFDDDNLPPLSQTIRDSWAMSAYPVSSAASSAALFSAIVALERRVIALEA
jgi:hypothetical protein